MVRPSMRSVLLFIFFISFGNLYAQVRNTRMDYGLEFSSYEVKTDHRTGLNLNPEDPYYFGDDFTISFDLSFRRLSNAYGYIVRIIANDSINIDLMSIPEHDDFGDVSLVINNVATPMQFEFVEENIKAFQWVTVKIHFSRNGEISMQLNGREKKFNHSLEDLNSVRLFFGVNDFGKFNTADAPPVTIKNIAIRDKDQLLNKWLLKEHAVDKVYDSLENRPALVKNPQWRIDRHVKWTHRKNFTLQKYPSVAFNSDSSILYAIDKNSFTTYDLVTEKLTRNSNKTGSFVDTEANQLIYVKENGTLYNYDLLANKINPYDFSKSGWYNQDTTHFEVDYWHNNKFFNPIDSTLYVFGGYGHYTYKNDFFRFDKEKNSWSKLNTNETIPPRYLAAAGIKESTNEVLFLGGYGSPTGQQELSSRAWYDLYSFNMATHKVEKLREYQRPTPGEDVVFSNSLVVDEVQGSFYVLSFYKKNYKNTIRLSQYFLDRPEIVTFQDSIPFLFHDEDSFCDLFYSAKTNELIAVTSHKDKQLFDINIYSIGFPPLMKEAVIQAEPKQAMAWVILLAIAGISLIGFVVYRYQRTTRQQAKKIVPQGTPQEQPRNINDLRQIQHDGEKMSSSILLFGGFQMYNARGVDISVKFTSTLKELFLLILVHSVNENGISASVVQELLWPDKDDTSARNNRNVNVKKLRDLLTEMDGLTIENNNSSLRVVMDEKIFCDYQVVSKLLNRTHFAPLTDGQRVDLILKNIHKGALLQDIPLNALDNYKADFSNQIIDTLLEYARQLDIVKDEKLLLEIADCTFAHDPINQEALVIKCIVLNKRGKYSLARRSYDVFVKVYKNLYAENYPRTFEEIISQPQIS